MVDGNGYVCGVCPECGENDCWNGKCMTCGYVEPEEELEESEE